MADFYFYMRKVFKCNEVQHVLLSVTSINLLLIILFVHMTLMMQHARSS